MNLFICPVCGQILKRKEKVYICKNSHSFDISSKGYVNLLPVNHKNSLAPGDDKEMVKARNLFLSKGYYSHLCETLENLAVKYTKGEAVVLDCGCGEGYYTSGVHSALISAKRCTQIMGIDISKEAVRLAAKRVKEAEFAVASTFHLPVAGGSVDFLINCFSPLCVEEFARVLKKDGIFAYVVPGADHLWELKCELYENPYKNEEKLTEYSGFQHIDTIKVEKDIFLRDNESLQNLFQMTPYVWKTTKNAKEKLLEKQSLKVHTEFFIYIYSKK